MKPCEICKNKNNNEMCLKCIVPSKYYPQMKLTEWNFEPIQPAVRKLTEKEYWQWINLVYKETDTPFERDEKRLSIGIRLGYIEPEPVKTALQKARENYINKSKDECDREEIIDRAESYITELEKAIEELKGENE